MSQIILDSANDLIQGDFDNATLSQRTRLQTSTVNATTGVYIIPNGTANAASVQISNNSNVTNASKVVVATNGSTDTQIISGANGSGTYLPLSFYTNNDIRFQMGNAGELNVRTAPGTVSSGTSGQFLTSGGPGAGVSWTTVAGGFSNMQVFASPGTFTTPSTTTRIKVTVVGCGGSAGNSGPGVADGGGGGGGGGAIFVGPVAASTPYAVTVGGAGGTSSFGALASATGGTSGVNGTPTTNGTGGAGGAGSAGTLLVRGSSGGNGGSNGAVGGSSLLGGSTRNNTTLSAGNSGANYGGGGSGSSGSTGGAGAGGVVVVEF